VNMARTNVEWVAQVSLLRPGSSGQDPFARGGGCSFIFDRGIIGLRPTQGDEKRLLFNSYSPWKHRPSLCHLDRSAAQWRDLRFNGPFLGMFFDRAAMDVRFLFVPLIVCFSVLAAQAKSQPQNPAPAKQPYTIQANSRVVLTDVTVTDRKGNPVHGLPESAFHIFDNKKPQTIATFEEHAGTPAVKLMPAMAPGGIYSNDYLLQLPPVLNVVIIDIANLGIAEQMYLYYELTKFFSEQPEGQPLAIYLRATAVFWYKTSPPIARCCWPHCTRPFHAFHPRAANT
jgi:hypothetical protein